MNTIKKTLGVIAMTVLFLPMTFVVAQQITGSTGSPGSTAPSALSANAKIENPLNYDTFSEFAAAVIETAVKVLMPFIVLAFIYSGFLFVKAQGNKEELAEAKTAIWYSVIGAFILLGSWGFAQIIGETISTITQ
ncbi:MAG: hypothetical protein A2747_03280 [Candidatus Yonathbacteria bacterium RIFCSPHIGHO2_01_FULL_44_41]|uniref:TrbC/VIRB2 family protein n=1 Tax=Candidatus Yonathbacteria bacterium RIFCSPHIGHO2_02_FULL_44_14 TaxID=1802724 RepID=A0A1G2S5V9_9BACT|nr:MAG: hypothetical protein A2747_03280 [Candidatus Yonathbacteria bacterium RIFCSPHIGHO2_01_FULL_44_41]OHA80483.1 MAG: hypothetical protein A3D51_00120 [Candidatus Yonathbacteria bacterium RIFCSPHIGHO2_02_FULL_44_14]OHA82228.1 MAG: hypothetical protein A3B06_01885 [Candidatus Yonathbacteria bacterium RIFCSPLOWO2_01_FULL_43_20]